MITEWVKEVARTPVLVKLTPNITDIRPIARAAKQGGADALSAINTINSITGIDLDTLMPRPNVDGASAHGGYCGPAVKPIALHMVQQIASDPKSACRSRASAAYRRGATRRSSSAGLRRACRSARRAMHYGYRIVEDMIDGLKNWMDEKGFSHHRRFPRPEPSTRHRVEAPEPELQDRRAHQCREMHRLRSVLHRLLGRRAPVHSCRWPFETGRIDRSVAPVDHGHADSEAGRRRASGNQRRRAFRASTKTNAWAAICAGWSARWKTASPWNASKPASRPNPGSSAHAGKI